MSSRWQHLPCPSCSSSDGFGYTEDTKSGYCFVCGYSERDSSQKNRPLIVRKRSKFKKEIRQFYKEVSKYFHQCLFNHKPAMEFYSRRGILDQTVLDLELGWIPRGKHPLCKLPEAYEAGLTRDHNTWFQAERVSFPFVVTEMGETEYTDLWARSIDPNCDPKYRYIGPNHSAYYRWADYPYLYDEGIEEEVVVTEGLIKAVLPFQHKKELHTGTVGFPGTLAKRRFEPIKGQKIIICFDNQINNRYYVNEAIKKKIAELQAFNPFVATLPLRGKEKQDIDSYILNYGVDEYNKVIRGALPYKEWLLLAS